MMSKLKADFHTHTADDPKDNIAYSTEQLIDAAAAEGIQVLAVTCHGAMAHNDYFARYAQDRGITLIPGIESWIQGRHFILLNPDAEQLRAKTFGDLRKLGARDAAFIAPHPYFPFADSLMSLLDENHDLFHAIEWHAFYFLGINFNLKAQQRAKEWGLPMVGSTDSHTMPYVPTTFTWVDADPTVESVIAAIREGRVELETRPRPLALAWDTVNFTIFQAVRDRILYRDRRRSFA